MILQCTNLVLSMIHLLKAPSQFILISVLPFDGHPRQDKLSLIPALNQNLTKALHPEKGKESELERKRLWQRKKGRRRRIKINEVQTYSSHHARVIIHCAFGGHTQGSRCDRAIGHSGNVSNGADLVDCIGGSPSLRFKLDVDCLRACNHCN